MKKKITIAIFLFLILFSGVKYAKTTPEKVYISGKLIGFEIENKNQEGTETEIPTSSRQIGTVTFVKEKNNEFVALGHPISSTENDFRMGICYDIKFGGIEKATEYTAGSVMAILDRRSYLGYIYENSEYGVHGRMAEAEENQMEVETGCWYDVKKGKANLLMCLDGEELKSYDAEIIEIDYLSKNQNIKIKVIDPELLERTGGIVQGMSGTPLMQDGKLIGAVNYVSVKSSDIGYAIFIDKLL